MNTRHLMLELGLPANHVDEVTLDVEDRTFRVTGVQRGTLLVEEILPEPPPPCATCGRERGEFPSIFRNSETCSDVCAKRAA